MRDSFHFKRRGIDLPPGCKDLIDVLNAAKTRTEPAVPVTFHDPSVFQEEVVGTAGDLEAQILKVFQSEAQFRTLTILPGRSSPAVELSKVSEEVFAYVVFRKGVEAEFKMQAFFKSHGLKAPEPATPSASWNTDLSFNLMYPVTPVTPALLARITTDLFRDMCGTDEVSPITFRHLEVGAKPETGEQAV